MKAEEPLDSKIKPKAKVKTESQPDTINKEQEKLAKPKFCRNCGERLNPDSKFCKKCGTKI
jgi:ribosomal protein L40E